MAGADDDAFDAADASVLQSNIRSLRDSAVQAHAKAVGVSRKLDGTVLILSTLTAGSLWFLCSSAGPAWLGTVAKWMGAVFATVCAVLTAYKEKITNYGKLADAALEHVRALEELIARSGDTQQSLRTLHAEYRGIKGELTAILVALDVRGERTGPPTRKEARSSPRGKVQVLLDDPNADIGAIGADVRQEAAFVLAHQVELRKSVESDEAKLRDLLDRLDRTAGEIAGHQVKARHQPQS